MAEDPGRKEKADGVRTLRSRFSWGTCIIGDAEMEDVPSGGSELERSETAVVFPVHDPTATDAEVVVRCHPGPTDEAVRFDGILAVPSGRLVVGDANGELETPIPSGRCRVQVRTGPAEAARELDVWIEPLPGKRPR